MNNKRKILISIATVVVVLIVSVGIFFIYVNNYSRADETALLNLQSNELVNVSYNDEYDFYAFEPTIAYTRAFVFYPGAKVEAKAYAPLMQAYAKQGVLCILLDVNFNLAILDINAAKGVQAVYPCVEKWTIGGHSLGGTVAARYVYKHPGEYSGIVFLASYPDRDLSQLDIKAISLYGDKDGVLRKEKLEETKPQMPNNYTIIELPGCNHSQFGSYGLQKKDGEATASPQEQINLTLIYSLSVIL